MTKIAVDFGKTLGPVKRMHGVNNGPLTRNLTMDARPQFKEAGIPIARLHDCEYPFGSGEYVNVPNIFKNFDADVDDPASYNFGLTDAYIEAIIECGTKPLYRLGIDIEHQPVKRYVFPPKDYLKWAKICEHIIRHYNEGWADGFHYDIEYWEIWCEPNHNKDMKFFAAPIEEFAKFYTVSTKYLKECFPNLKIGGPAFSNATLQYTVDFFEAIKDEHPPLDFFAHHAYFPQIEEPVHRIEVARELLDKYGYHESENLLDEWNFMKSWSNVQQAFKVINDYRGMAFNAAVMAALQNTDCDIACYYAAQMTFANLPDAYCGLFDYSNRPRINGGWNPVDTKKPFYPFICFGNLYRMGTQIEAASDDAEVYTVAATDGSKGGLMLSTFVDPTDDDLLLDDKIVEFEIKNAPGKTAKLYLCDENNEYGYIGSCAASAFSVKLAPYSLLYVEFE